MIKIIYYLILFKKDCRIVQPKCFEKGPRSNFEIGGREGGGGGGGGGTVSDSILGAHKTPFIANSL